MELSLKLSLTTLIATSHLGAAQVIFGPPAWSRPDPNGGSNNLASAVVPSSHIDAPTFPVHSMLTPSSIFSPQVETSSPSGVEASREQSLLASTTSDSLVSLVTGSHQVVPSTQQSTFDSHTSAQSFDPVIQPTEGTDSVPSSLVLASSELATASASAETTSQLASLCTQTVVVFDVVTVHAGCSEACGFGSAMPSVGSMTAVLSSVPGGVSTTASILSSNTFVEQQTLETESGSQTYTHQSVQQPSSSLSFATGSSGLAYSVPTTSSVSTEAMSASQTSPASQAPSTASEVAAGGGGGVTPSSHSSYTLVAMPSPPIPVESSLVEATITTSSSTPVRTTFATTAENLPATTVLSSLIQVSSHSHSSSSSLAAAVSSEVSSQAASTQPAALSEAGGGAGCTSVPAGARPSPAYTNPQNGLMYRIQCGTTTDLVQQCPYLCSEGGGGLFRQCQKNDESGTDGQSGAPIICQQCLPPCGGAGSAREEAKPLLQEMKQAAGPQAHPSETDTSPASYLGALGRLGYYPQWTANLLKALRRQEKKEGVANREQGKRSPKVVTLSRPRGTAAK